ncbi:MAG: FAD-dependent oxidoreductase [Rhodospirillales bacterium]
MADSENVYNLNRIAEPPAPPGAADDTADKHYVPAPCQVACPIGTDAPSYIGFIWEEKWAEAFEAITATNPFSSICGRVCDAPCEPACRRAQADGPIMIRNLKRYVMDRAGNTIDPPAVPVTRKETVAVVGGGPAGLTAAHQLSLAGFEVHVYEMTDRLGGMMIWGIPAFRLPAHIIQEDIDRLTTRCPGLKIHLNTPLGHEQAHEQGPGVTLDELKQRHDAVLLTIGAWWGKKMGVDGEDDARVVDGVKFLRAVNDGARPETPETVAVIGGGDVAMDACRAALRLPGCRHVKVIYRRGPDEIPARAIELEGAVQEGVEFIYNTQQTGVSLKGNGLALHCVKTGSGEPDADGRRRPVVQSGSEHDIDCGMVIAAVGQQGESPHLESLGLMAGDRVKTEWETMRTDDPKVFAAGDGAFGGSTIVMAMHHGQRAAYYVQAFLDGVETPRPYRTPHRTRRVPVAQDIMWERFPQQHPPFHGLGENPSAFPEIESTYTDETAKAEAARCYRCDAETGSTDYGVRHREDIFSMARTNPLDHAKHAAMLTRRLRVRDDPFPTGRPASLDDLVFLPANLSRLVIDPYREACRTSAELGGRLTLAQPFAVTGFDDAPEDVRAAVLAALADSKTPYIGRARADALWFQLAGEGDTPAAEAAAVIHVIGGAFRPVPLARPGGDAQLLGMAVSNPAALEETLAYAVESGVDIVLLDGAGGLGETPWPETAGQFDLTLARDAVKHLRKMNHEESVDLIWFGGARSGTDAAKMIGLGCKVTCYGLQAALAAGGALTAAGGVEFSAPRTAQERKDSVLNILKANAGEASMMARCTGKTALENVEPEDLRAVTLAAAGAAGIPMAGARAGAGADSGASVEAAE